MRTSEAGHPGIFFYCFLNTMYSDILLFRVLVFAYIVGKYSLFICLFVKNCSSSDFLGSLTVHNLWYKHRFITLQMRIFIPHHMGNRDNMARCWTAGSLAVIYYSGLPWWPQHHRAVLCYILLCFCQLCHTTFFSPLKFLCHASSLCCLTLPVCLLLSYTFTFFPSIPH